MNDFKDFVTPPDHTDFLAKKLFGNAGEIIDDQLRISMQTAEVRQSFIRMIITTFLL